jgi:hypothetical protein
MFITPFHDQNRTIVWYFMSAVFGPKVVMPRANWEIGERASETFNRLYISIRLGTIKVDEDTLREQATGSHRSCLRP